MPKLDAPSTHRSLLGLSELNGIDAARRIRALSRMSFFLSRQLWTASAL